MSFFSGIFAGEAPRFTDLAGFNPAHERGLVNAAGRAQGEVMDHWLFSSAIPEWIQYILSFSAAAAVLMIVVGGAMIMLGGEDEEYKTRGIKTVTWSIAGLVITVLSYTIVEIVNQVPVTGNSLQTELLAEDRDSVSALATGDILTYIIPQIIQVILSLMGTAALLILIYAGGLMVLRDGDEERTSKARSLIIYAMVGIIVSVMAYIIIEAVLQINLTEAA